MPRFAANLTLLYPELEFLDRFAAAAADGFAGVEMLFPYGHAPADLAARLADSGLELVLFNTPPGDANAGERGLAALPARKGDFRRALEQALAYAQALRCPRVHVMSGVLPAGQSRQQSRDCLLDNLAWAAPLAASCGVSLMIKPINTRDIPGYFVNTQADAHALVQALGAPNVQVQMDLYHCQIVEGDLATKLREYLPTGRVGHMQIAGVPERHEPDVGELHYPYLFELIDSLGYAGWVGCEYRPRRGAVPGGTTTGLGWRPRPVQQAV
jgi:hydroxypyruvate isomerase